MTFESEGLLIVAIYTWLPPASYVVFSDNSGLPIVFDCCDVIKICGQLWSQEQPSMKFWASFLWIYGIQQAKQIRKLRYGLAWLVGIEKSKKKLHTNFM